MLPSAVQQLLPTPSVADGMGGHLTRSGERGGELLLPGLAKAHAEGKLLPTPAAHEPGGTAEQYHARLKAHDGRESTFLPLSMAVQLLPTPTTRDAAASGGSTPSAVTLTDAIVRTDLGRQDNPRHLLPTPTAMDRAGAVADRREESGHGPMLRDVPFLLPTPTTEPDTGNGHARNLGAEVKPAAWGDYAGAVRRWEALTRPAPSPTEIGPKGAPRLSARFSEWMMGVPAGWITDVPGITRNEALKLAGNGVVPQQAEAALRILLPVLIRWGVAA
ncbi:hypothetical protein [Nocardioides fonticola]